MSNAFAEVHGRAKRSEGEGRPSIARYWGTKAYVIDTQRSEL